MRINVHRNVPRQFSSRKWRMDSSRDTEGLPSSLDDRHLGSTVAPYPAMDTECWLHPLFASCLPTREVWVLDLDVWALSPSAHMVGRISGNQRSIHPIGWNQLWWIYSSLRQSDVWNWHHRHHAKFSNLFQYFASHLETAPTYIDKTVFRPRM